MGEVGAVTIQARGPHTGGLGGVRPRERDVRHGDNVSSEQFCLLNKIDIFRPAGHVIYCPYAPVPALRKGKYLNFNGKISRSKITDCF